MREPRANGHLTWTTNSGVLPMKMICLFVSTVLLGTGAAAAQDSMPDLPYVKTASVTLPSTDTGWDYVKFEPGSARLFMARLDDGLTLFDVEDRKSTRLNSSP